MSISLDKSPFKCVKPCKHAKELNHKIWCDNETLCTKVDGCKHYEPVDEYIDASCNDSLDIVEFATYKHYKGKLYRILCIAEHTETQEKFVVYRALYPPYAAYARPFNMFCEQIEDLKLKYRGPRFKKIS